MEPDKPKGKVGLLSGPYFNGLLLIISLSNVIAYLRVYTSHTIDSTWSPAELATYEFVTLCAYQLWMILNVILFLAFYAYYACLERIKNEYFEKRNERNETNGRNEEGFTESQICELETRFGEQKGLTDPEIDYLAKRIGRISAAHVTKSLQNHPRKFEEVKRDAESQKVQQPQTDGGDNTIKNSTSSSSSAQTSTLKAEPKIRKRPKIRKGRIHQGIKNAKNHEVPSPDKCEKLEKYFQSNSHPTMNDFDDIAKQLRVTPSQVVKRFFKRRSQEIKATTASKLDVGPQKITESSETLTTQGGHMKTPINPETSPPQTNKTDEATMVDPLRVQISPTNATEMRILSGYMEEKDELEELGLTNEEVSAWFENRRQLPRVFDKQGPKDPKEDVVKRRSREKKSTPVTRPWSLLELILAKRLEILKKQTTRKHNLPDASNPRKSNKEQLAIKNGSRVQKTRNEDLPNASLATRRSNPVLELAQSSQTQPDTSNPQKCNNEELAIERIETMTESRVRKTLNENPSSANLSTRGSNPALATTQSSQTQPVTTGQEQEQQENCNVAEEDLRENLTDGGSDESWCLVNSGGAGIK